MMTEKRQTYTAEFKREAVRLVTEQRYGGAETARNLGLNVNRLRRWKQAYTANTQVAFPGNGHLPPGQEERRQLRDEVKRLRMEREIVKKARRFFVNASRCGMPVSPSTTTRGRWQCSVRSWR
jgi:transposase